MPLEDLTGIKFVGHLVPTNPDGGDDISQGDDHVRGIKNVIQQQFGTAVDGSTTLPGDLHVGGDITLDGTLPQLDTFRNLLINGEMMINQNGTGVVVSDFGANGVDYGADMWNVAASGDPEGRINFSSNTTGGPVGFPAFIRADCTTAEPGVADVEIIAIEQRIEARMVRHLHYGASGAKTLYLRFWVRSPKTGLHAVAVFRAQQNRTITLEYTVAVANTWEEIRLVVPGDAGDDSITDDNSEGLRLRFPLMAGANTNQAPGAWAPGVAIGTGNQQNLLDNVANNFDLTGVSLELTEQSDFEHIPYDVTLARCQRYYHRIHGVIGNEQLATGSQYTATNMRCVMYAPVAMRAPIVVKVHSQTGFNCTNGISSTTNASTAITNSNPSPQMAVFNVSSTGYNIGSSGWIQFAGGGGWFDFDVRL